MVKRKFKSFVVPMIYFFALLVFGGCLYLVQNIFSEDNLNNSNMIYVDSEIVR